MKIKRFPLYKQHDSSDCGPACLKMICKYYGKSYSIEYLRERSYITREGVSILGISEAAENIGFQTKRVKLSFEQLTSIINFPCILYWNQNHFVVCYGVRKIPRKNDYKIFIADPVGEKYTLNLEEFLNCWVTIKQQDKMTGIALVLSPTPDFYNETDNDEKSKKKISHYFRYLRPYKAQIIQLSIGLIIGSLLQFVIPFLTQAMVDQGVNNNNLDLITLILIGQLAIFFTQLAVEFIRNWIFLHVNTRISISLISDFLIKLMKLPIRFFDSKNTGDILQRIEDNDRIKNFLTGSTLSTLFSFINFIIFAVILGYYNLTILSIFILGNVLYILWILLFMRYRRKLDYKRFTQTAAEQSNLIELITGMQDIKLSNTEKQKRWNWERIQIKLFNISIKGLAIEQYQQVGTLFFTQTTSLLILFMAAKLVVSGSISIGMMMAISYIVGQLGGPISQVIGFIQTTQDAKISLERLNEIQNKEDEDVNTVNQLKYLPEDKELKLNNIKFTYDGSNRNYIINDVNLIIPGNKVTAIVGASGSGKTTLIKIMLGFYAPNSGNVMMGDTDIQEINSHILRQNIGAVLQDSFIFSDTIVKNITMEEDNINKEQLLRAVEIANIREFIESLPLKYNTKIGMEGNGLSQGQRQRILIARAVYKNPSFLFLDEATNALDANNEKVIIDNLNEFYRGRTVVIVAHRLSTVQNADNIIVLEKGKVLEMGRHEELVRNKSAYYSLVKNQLELGV